jgi:hypothetical protein
MAAPAYNFQTLQSPDAGTLYVNDITGAFSANGTGYGGSNTSRLNLALIMLAKYKPLSGDVRLTVSAYDPEGTSETQVSQWVIPSISTYNDGHFEFNIYQVPKSGTEGTAVAGLFRWDYATNLLERYTGAAWVTSPATNGNQYLELETYDRPHTTVDYPVLSDMWIALNNLNKLSILGCKTESRSDIQKAIMETTNMLNGTISLFAEGAFSQAQENVEKYQSRVEYLLSLS